MEHKNLTELEKLKIVEMDILDEIDRVCRKNNLSYFLGGGNLLGAIRHQGFIPWDDDIDIYMLRKDYERFAEIANRELSENYFYQNWITEPEYPYNFAKVRMNHTVFDEKGLSHLNIHKGIWVDIFAIDKQTEDAGIAEREQKRSRRLQAAQELLYVDLNKNRNVFKSLLLRLYRALIPRAYMHKKLDKLLKKYNHTESKLCADRLSKGAKSYYTDDFAQQIYVKYEDKQYPIPNGYDHILKAEFGDYMQYPPPAGSAPASRCFLC